MYHSMSGGVRIVLIRILLPPSRDQGSAQALAGLQLDSYVLNNIVNDDAPLTLEVAVQTSDKRRVLERPGEQRGEFLQ